MIGISPLTMIHLWEYPLEIFIKEIEMVQYVNSQKFNIAGILIESPSLNQTFLEYDTLPITWSFNSMFNLFNASLCINNVNIYNINISQCEYSIIEDYQPNSLEINSGEINYNWIVPELIDTYQDYKILISSMNNSIMMISSLFTIENNPSNTPTTTLTTTPTTTLTTTPTTTLTSSTMTTTTIYPAEPDTHFPIYIPILSALDQYYLYIYYVIVLNYVFENKKHKSNRIRPTGREFYNNNYESNNNRYNDEHVIYNESPNYVDINNRILNNMYHETSFGKGGFNIIVYHHQVTS